LRSEKNVFFTTSADVYTFPHEISPGQYAIPFSFRLPSNLPNSFYQEGHNHLGRIHYTLEAYMTSNYQKDIVMSHKQRLIVRESFSGQPLEFTRKTSKELSSCFCKYGVATLTAGFGKEAYKPGEFAEAIVGLDLSKSKKDCGPISISLIHYVSLETNRSYRSFPRAIKTVNIEGVRAGSNNGMNKIHIKLPQASQEDNYHKAKSYGIENYLRNKSDTENNFINVTTKGRFVKSWYELQASCVSEGCGSAYMFTSCPMVIYSPEIKFAPIAAPDNWNPTQVEQVSFAFAPYHPQTETTAPTSINNAMLNNLMSGGFGGFGGFGFKDFGLKHFHNVSLKYGQKISPDYTTQNYQPPTQFGEENLFKEHAKL